MNEALKKAAWETVRLLKQARLAGHSACYRSLADSRFRQSVERLRVANPPPKELVGEYAIWLSDLKALKDIIALKMYLKNRILSQGGSRFSGLDLAIVLLDLMAEKNCNLIARAISGSEIIFSAITRPLEIVADWGTEDERTLTEEVRWNERKRLLAKTGGVALLLGIGYWYFRKNKGDKGAK